MTHSTRGGGRPIAGRPWEDVSSNVRYLTDRRKLMHAITSSGRRAVKPHAANCSGSPIRDRGLCRILDERQQTAAIQRLTRERSANSQILSSRYILGKWWTSKAIRRPALPTAVIRSAA